MNETDISPSFTQMDQSPFGYEAHYCYNERMEVTQYHCHDYFEFYVHIAGGQLMGVDNRLYALKPNQLFILPPFFMHGLSCTEEMHGYERAYLNLSPEVLRDLGCGQLDLPQFFRSHASHGRYTYQLSEEQASRFVSLVREIQKGDPAAADPLRRLRDYSLMIHALTMICDVFVAAAPAESEPISNGIIQDVLTYINHHYTEPLNVSDLARLFNVSASYLAHEFSHFTNRSVYNYILYRRVILARQQLLGDESLSSIAYQCGFSDYSNFLRSFTKITGTSPSLYRKMLHQYHKREL
ncbi:MAG: helix-turn-helix transcriptional regulator [Clostridia bacterium]|nr:helix-turn-helix transcriptional regulator [Clostridia bacterium]